MKHRTVLQNPPASPPAAPSKAPTIEQLRASAVYTDSAHRTTKALRPLFDGDTKQGGVVYQA